MNDEYASKALRKILRDTPDGSTAPELAKTLGVTADAVRKALKRMPDSYISDWMRVHYNGAYTAIWKVVVPPPDMPCPEIQNWQGRGFKACDPDWLEKQQAREANRKLLKQRLANRNGDTVLLHSFVDTKPKPVVPSDMKSKRVDETPKQRHVPQKTVWQPVKPWSKT